MRKEDVIDNLAGIRLHKKYGDRVESGDVLAVLYASDEALFAGAEKRLREAYRITETIPEKTPLIYAKVDKDGVHPVSV